DTNCTHGGERCTDMSFFKGIAEGVCNTAQMLGGHVVLTTQLQHTPAVASQTEPCLTTEHTAGLSVITGSQRETVLKLENSLQAISQVFGTTKTPTVAGLNRVVQTSFGGLDAAVVL